MEPKFKEQHMEPAPPPTIINKEEEYEIEEVRKHQKRGKGCSTWCIGRAMGMNTISG